MEDKDLKRISARLKGLEDRQTEITDGLTSLQNTCAELLHIVSGDAEREGSVKPPRKSKSKSRVTEAMAESFVQVMNELFDIIYKNDVQTIFYEHIGVLIVTTQVSGRGPFAQLMALYGNFNDVLKDYAEILVAFIDDRDEDSEEELPDTEVLSDRIEGLLESGARIRLYYSSGNVAFGLYNVLFPEAGLQAFCESNLVFSALPKINI